MAKWIISLEECIPAVLVGEDAIVSRDGAITVGWELFPPDECSLGAEQYDSLTALLSAAFRSLPEWTMVHKQDIYRRRLYHSEGARSFLGACYAKHFEGRPYLEHRQYIWFTFNPSIRGKAGAMKGVFQAAASGIRYHSPEMKGLISLIEGFEGRCSEFIASLTGSGLISARRVTDTDLEGTPGGLDGLLQEYLRWFGGPLEGTDITLEGGTYLDRDTRRLLSYSFSRPDDLPGEVSNSMKARGLSGLGGELFLSSASPIGTGLDQEHIVNAYWLVPSQQHALRDLDHRRRSMMAMSRGSAENSVNAEGIERFIAMIHSESTMAVYSHMNLICWGPKDQEAAIRGAAGGAISAMGLTGKLNTLDTAQLWIAGIPGGEMEIGAANLFLTELESSLCLTALESYMRDLPGGTLRITDRRRHVPVTIDTQEAAYRANLIENYNAFILGPSGTGKSFFTAWYVRSCYDLGQSVFIIDKGASYEGLCALISEASGGQDGVYYTWSPERPLSFAPLEGCREWNAAADGAGGGMGFFVSLIRLIWTPRGGWDAVADSVLFKIIEDFIGSLPPDGDDPIFEDFLRYLRDEVRPLILGKRKGAASSSYVVGGVEVTPELFDIRGMCVALAPYGEGGRFGFLLSRRRAEDLFTSRFVVFEVDALAETDPTLYSLCTFCIIRAFERKMRSGDPAFRLLFIEEAWQAIALEGTADYLRTLWKTARKWHTSAVVVTQQLSDILSSPVVKDAIISNSPVKILLDQSSNAASFDTLSSLLGLSPVEKALVGSVGRGIPSGARYKEVFISLGGKRSGVYALEVSPEEALVYESDKVRKRPLLERARECGSIINAVYYLARNNEKDDRL